MGGSKKKKPSESFQKYKADMDYKGIKYSERHKTLRVIIIGVIIAITESESLYEWFKNLFD